MKLALAIAAVLTMSIGGCSKSDENTADEADTPDLVTKQPVTPPENPAKPDIPDAPDTPEEPEESGEEAVPTEVDFEEEASATITEENLEDELAKLEKELGDE